jgi:hypothetical protein
MASTLPQPPRLQSRGGPVLIGPQVYFTIRESWTSPAAQRILCLVLLCSGRISAHPLPSASVRCRSQTTHTLPLRSAGVRRRSLDPPSHGRGPQFESVYAHRPFPNQSRSADALSRCSPRLVNIWSTFLGRFVAPRMSGALMQGIRAVGATAAERHPTHPAARLRARLSAARFSRRP